jgi:uncharacterized protein (DUF1684 family)
MLWYKSAAGKPNRTKISSERNASSMRRQTIVDLVLSLVLAVWALASLIGCDSGARAPGPVQMSEEEQESWEIALVEMRIEKNEAFMDSTTSPLPVEDLPGFEGLNYYYPEPGLRYHVPLRAEARPDTVVMTKRKGDQVRYTHRGTVFFRHEGRTYDLAVYGPADSTGDDFLWLPFYDATNGEETYAGGRYLDLDLQEDGTVELDFNYAYNPLCDYNPERYNCTLPPARNTLPFPVRAGEKLFHPAAAGE